MQSSGTDEDEKRLGIPRGWWDCVYVYVSMPVKDNLCQQSSLGGGVVVFFSLV